MKALGGYSDGGMKWIYSGMDLTMLITMAVLVQHTVSGETGVEIEYCIRDTFNVTCPGENDVILMTSAMYGRMRTSRCINEKHGHVGCMTSVTAQLDSRCSGRRRCIYPVKDLMDLKPCQQDDLHSFLIATYECVQVTQGACIQSGSSAPAGGSPTGVSSRARPSALLIAQDGYVMPAHYSARCPWNITVDPRQSLKFTLYDFRSEFPHPDGPDPQSGLTQVCPWSLVFEEVVEGKVKVKDESLCQMRTREAVFYRSRGHSVLVTILHTQTVAVPTTYLLKYEAQGCPSIQPPDHSYVEHGGQTARIKCNHSDEIWYLACNNRHWNGLIANCSVPPGHLTGRTSGDAVGRQGRSSALPLGFVMAVIVGVLLGVFIGAVPLALVYGCLRRKWRLPAPGIYGVREPVDGASRQGGAYYQEGGTYGRMDSRGRYPSLLSKQEDGLKGNCCGYSPTHDSYPLDIGPCSGMHQPQSPCQQSLSELPSPHWSREENKYPQHPPTTIDCCHLLADTCPDVTCPAHLSGPVVCGVHHVYESTDKHRHHQPLLYYEVDASAMAATINRSAHLSSHTTNRPTNSFPANT